MTLPRQETVTTKRSSGIGRGNFFEKVWSGFSGTSPIRKSEPTAIPSEGSRVSRRSRRVSCLSVARDVLVAGGRS